MSSIINIRQRPEWLERAADYFSSRWSIDRQLYLDSMKDSLETENPVPRWYLMLRGDEIIGGFGLIDNDFMVRTDLCPWLCALYIEPHERGRQLGARLLAHSIYEAEILGFSKVYLNTDHVGYYEKYDWRYIGDFAHQSGVDTRVYEAEIPDGVFYHFDTPFTPETEIRLMKTAGFVDVEILRQWESASIIIANRNDCADGVYGNGGLI